MGGWCTRKTVRLERQKYRKNVQKFRTESAKLVGIVGEQFLIHHVGSTAIPNMSGKNILDVLIGVPSSKDLKGTMQKLEANGYFPGKRQEIDYIFLASRTEETGSGDIHIHLTVIGSERYNDFIYLRDYLLGNPIEATKYQDAKYQIVKKTNGNRSDYKREKAKYVANLLKKARCYHEATEGTDTRQTRREYYERQAA